MSAAIYRHRSRLELRSVTCSICGNDFDAWCSWEPQMGGWHFDGECPHCEARENGE